MTGPLTPLRVLQHHFGVSCHDDQMPVGIADHVAVPILTLAVECRFDARLLGATLGGAADVEGPHGKLRARLADRLSGDNAHRLADIDPSAARKIAAVAVATDTTFAFAGQHRADLHRSMPAASIRSTPPRR